MRTCTRCKEEKPLEYFRSDRTKKDGKASNCKVCQNKATLVWQKNNPEKANEKARNWRINNPEKVREKERKRYADNPEKAREKARRRYARNPEKFLEFGKRYRQIHKEKVNERLSNWRANNQEKTRTHSAVLQAMRTKAIMKPTDCECCGKQGVTLDGHHDDYAKPLEIRWLCRQCHNDWHRQNGEAPNGKTTEPEQIQLSLIDDIEGKITMEPAPGSISDEIVSRALRNSMDKNRTGIIYMKHSRRWRVSNAGEYLGTYDDKHQAHTIKVLAQWK